MIRNCIPKQWVHSKFVGKQGILNNTYWNQTRIFFNSEWFQRLPQTPFFSYQISFAVITPLWWAAGSADCLLAVAQQSHPAPENGLYCQKPQHEDSNNIVQTPVVYWICMIWFALIKNKVILLFVLFHQVSTEIYKTQTPANPVATKKEKMEKWQRNWNILPNHSNRAKSTKPGYKFLNLALIIPSFISILWNF